MDNPLRQPIHVDTLYDYRLMLADGRPVLGVIGGGHAQPFTEQEKVAIAAHAVACWNAVAENAALRAEVVQLREALAHIERLMGPVVPPCCEGCNHEWAEALKTVRAARKATT